jgi:hypothetical protein
MAKRWQVELDYRHDAGTKTQRYEVEEISEIETLVEKNHDWNTLVQARFWLNPSERTAPHDYTVEQSEVA